MYKREKGYAGLFCDASGRPRTELREREYRRLSSLGAEAPLLLYTVP